MFAETSKRTHGQKKMGVKYRVRVGRVEVWGLVGEWEMEITVLEQQ